MTRLALVGYGKVAPKHLEVFRALGAAIVASCNRSEEGRTLAQSEGGIPNSYPDPVEMIERERPEGILVCPTFSQVFHVATRVLPFGIPTLLEKPPGTSLAELTELERLAQAHATPVMVGLNRRHYSVVQRAIADAGGLERITAVFVEWSEDPRHVLKRATPEEVGRWMFGNSLHGLDLLTHLAGAVPTPAILARNLGDPFRWLTALQGVSTRGVLASFQSTWDSPGKWRVSFCVPDRRYVFAPLESCTVLERGKEDRVIEPSETDRQFKAGFYDQARHFVAVVRGGASPAPHDLPSCRPAVELAERLTNAVMDSSSG